MPAACAAQADVYVPPSAVTPRAIRRGWLRLVVTLALLLGLPLFIHPREIVAALARISPTALVIAIIVLSLDRILMGVKWQHLIRGAGGRLRLRDAIGIYFQSKFLTLAFPASFGGELLRAVLGTRAGVPGHLVLASMLLERVIAAFSSTLLAGLGLLYLFIASKESSPAQVLLVGGAGMAIGTIAAVLMNRRLHLAVAGLAGRYLPERILQFAGRLSAAATSYRSRPGVLAVNLGLNLSEHLLQMFALLILALGLGVALSTTHFLAASALVMLVRRGAGILEGWGLAESGLIMLYNISGVPAAQSAALALALWATSLCATLPGAFLLPRSAVRG